MVSAAGKRLASSPSRIHPHVFCLAGCIRSICSACNAIVWLARVKTVSPDRFFDVFHGIFAALACVGKAACRILGTMPGKDDAS